MNAGGKTNIQKRFDLVYCGLLVGHGRQAGMLNIVRLTLAVTTCCVDCEFGLLLFHSCVLAAMFGLFRAARQSRQLSMTCQLKLSAHQEPT